MSQRIIHRKGNCCYRQKWVPGSKDFVKLYFNPHWTGCFTRGLLCRRVFAMASCTERVREKDGRCPLSQTCVSTQLLFILRTTSWDKCVLENTFKGWPFPISSFYIWEKIKVWRKKWLSLGGSSHLNQDSNPDLQTKPKDRIPLCSYILASSTESSIHSKAVMINKG